MGNVIARIAAATLCVALLASCGSGSDPAPSTTPATTPAPVPQTTSPPASPTPTETPTVETVRPEIDIPEPEKYPEMANDDIQGADTAARYFLDLYGYMYNTGDLKTWNKVVDPSCALCTAIAQQVEELYAKGDWFEGVARLHAEALVYYPTDDDPSYLVVLRVVSAPHKHFDATGAVLTSTEEKTTPEYAVSVQYLAPNEWKVVGAGDLGSVK